jgi:hypothetical protein
MTMASLLIRGTWTVVVFQRYENRTGIESMPPIDPGAHSSQFP